VEFPPSIGFGGITSTDKNLSTGDFFGIFQVQYVTLAPDYISGSPLNSSTTFAGATFDSLGIDTTGAPYVWKLSNDETVTIQFETPQGVPESSTIVGLMAIVGFGASLKQKLKR
jgi:hypothetical protein